MMTNFTDESKLLDDLDRDRIVELNTFIIMKQYGYILKDSDRLEQECKKHLVGGIIVKRSEQLEMFELATTFEETKDDKPAEDYDKVLYEYLKQGKIDIEMIQLTRKYDETIKKYREFSNNSFLPNELKEPLDKIIDNITYDISHTIKQVLEQFILDLYTKSKETKNFKINPSGVYNVFNRKRRDNDDLLKLIRSRTREYLLIDKKW